MDKFKKKDKVVALAGLYKNIPTRINGIYHIDGFETKYIMRNFSACNASTVESNLRLISRNEKIPVNAEILEHLYVFCDFASPVGDFELAIDHGPTKPYWHEQTPHIHFFKCDYSKKNDPGFDIHYEYGGALSLVDDHYVVHDNHDEKLSQIDCDIINNWLHDDVHWNFMVQQLEMRIGRKLDIEPIYYKHNMEVEMATKL